MQDTLNIYGSKGDATELVSTAAMYNPHKVSGRYRPIDTEALVRQIVGDLGMDEDSTIDVLRPRGKSSRHGVVLTVGSPVMLAGTSCFPRIYVRNSYAGESSLTVDVGFYRLICSNGMMVGSTHFRGRIRHVQSGVSQLDWLRTQIVAAVQWLQEELPQLVTRLNSNLLTIEQIRAILGAIGAGANLLKHMEHVMYNPTHYLRPEDRSPQGLTAWNVWNVVNEQMRRRSRSPLRQLERNSGLLDAINAEISQAA